MGTRHLTVSDKETSRCECCKSASDNVCIFVIDSFRFLWPGKCFIVSVGIINAFAVLFIFSALGVAVINRRCCLCDLLYFLLAAPAAATATIPSPNFLFLFDIEKLLSDSWDTSHLVFLRYRFLIHFKINSHKIIKPVTRQIICGTNTIWLSYHLCEKIPFTKCLK